MPFWQPHEALSVLCQLCQLWTLRLRPEVANVQTEFETLLALAPYSSLMAKERDRTHRTLHRFHL
jgi:hypothetical protein